MLLKGLCRAPTTGHHDGVQCLERVEVLLSGFEYPTMRTWVTYGLFVLVSIACLIGLRESLRAREVGKPQPIQTRQLPEGTSQAGSAANGRQTTAVLKESTPIKLKLLHTLNSKTVASDDPLNFSVAEDVIVEDQILVAAGSTAVGRVQDAKPARTLGRGAELGLEMQYVKAGQIRVPLRGSQVRAGEGKTGDTVAMVALFGLSGLVKHGSEIEVKEGSLFTAYVDRDTTVTVLSGPSDRN